MAVRPWENGLNREVWTGGYKCGSCGGNLKYKYHKKPGNYELHILPNAKIFRVFIGKALQYSGPITEMINYLNTI